MKTEESNKMIAEFMGNIHDGDVIHEELYDVSWDWLMPVVDKIEKELPVEYVIEQYQDDCRIHEIIDGVWRPIIEIYNETSRRDATYEAIVGFIKWYNENKK